ncbi:winged helix-turn-helix transcriptional regulator [Brevibacterium sandarakinum]|uniref:winged helix-turn-helix transcriptional regulator n=1 Tax=Brevibacterium sandarakinum TaxID=629680 RepID=UPI0022B25DF3|nr:helix-turn-helix domain-containing protein [Brevibacterium sandarakinum]
MEVATAVLGGAWKLTIVKHLLEKPYRYGQLCRALPLAPPRSLTRQLRELEEDGIVRREVYAEVPPKVEYSLTPLGDSLAPIVDQINAWGKSYPQ